MHQKELHIVRISMLVLFSALMIIYLLLYQIKGDDIVNQLSSISQSNITQLKDTEKKSSISDSLNRFDEESVVLETKSNLIEKENSLFDDAVKNDIDEEKIIILSGTSLWYGRVDAVEKLGISYQYALKDSKDIYYVFMDPNRYEFDTIVKSLGGSIYTISTEKEIIENKLFGDKVIFINLKEYEKEKVVMLIEIEKRLWLIQVNYSNYHNSKGHIKQLFIH